MILCIEPQRISPERFTPFKLGSSCNFLYPPRSPEIILELDSYSGAQIINLGRESTAARLLCAPALKACAQRERPPTATL